MMMDDYKNFDNFQRTEGCKKILPHHFHPINGVPRILNDEGFNRVDRNVLWEETDNPHIIQVNDRSGKVYVNVITGEESDTAERSNP